MTADRPSNYLDWKRNISLGVRHPVLTTSSRHPAVLSSDEIIQSVVLCLFTLVGGVMVMVICLIALQELKIMCIWLIRSRQAMTRPPSYTTVTKPPSYSTCLRVYQEDLDETEPPAYSEIYSNDDLGDDELEDVANNDSDDSETNQLLESEGAGSMLRSTTLGAISVQGMSLSENENSQDEFGFFSMVDSTLGKADRDKGSSDTSGDTLPTLPQSTASSTSSMRLAKLTKPCTSHNSVHPHHKLTQHGGASHNHSCSGVRPSKLTQHGVVPSTLPPSKGGGEGGGDNGEETESALGSSLGGVLLPTAESLDLVVYDCDYLTNEACMVNTNSASSAAPQSSSSTNDMGETVPPHQSNRHAHLAPMETIDSDLESLSFPLMLSCKECLE